MKQHSGAPPRLHALRMTVQRFAFATLVVMAFGLMLLGKADTILAERARIVIADAVAPILDGLSRPAAAIGGVFDSVHELTMLRAENTRLREQNARLLQWQTAARHLEAENQELRRLLNFAPAPERSNVTGRVIADPGGVFVHSLLVHAGARDGVGKGNAVVTGEGLVGRISDVGQRSSRILLITDINSRIPVLVEGSRQRAVLAGDNTAMPRLLYLDDPSRLSPGDRIVTSGVAGAFPPGLPIGVVGRIGDNTVRVTPFVDRGRLEMVRIIDYGMSGILDSWRKGGTGQEQDEGRGREAAQTPDEVGRNAEAQP